MNEKIKKILEDLYAIDSSLRTEEKKLIRVIEMLLAAEPDTKFDRAFAERLRADLMKSTISVGGMQKMSWFTSISFRMAFAGVVALLLVVPMIAYVVRLQNNNIPEKIAERAASKNIITPVNDNAFGTLAFESGGVGGDTILPSETSKVQSAEPARVGAPIAPTLGASSAPGAVGFGGGSTAPAMPIYIGKVQRFVYTGGEFDLSDNQGIVLRRKKGFTTKADMQSIIKSDLGGVVDIRSFRDPKIQNIDFWEDSDNGYMVNINFSEGIISINRQWKEFEIYQEKEGEKSVNMSDRDIITIVNTFLADHGISREGYGEPEILDAPEIMPMGMGVAGASDTATLKEPSQNSARMPIRYWPLQRTVVYPLRLHDLAVFEQGGASYGVQVSVDIRTRSVMSVGNLMSQAYDASRYALITDKKRVIDSAEQGGFWGYVNPTFDASRIEYVDVPLGTPQKVLMHFWHYRDNTSDELFVPALAFPVLEYPKDVYVYQKYIVVPIVADLLKVSSPEPLPLRSEKEKSSPSKKK